MKDIPTPLLFTTILKILVSSLRQGKEIEDIQIGKEDMKLPLFSDNMIVSVENPPKSTTNILKLVSEYSKVTGNKSLYKSMVTDFLYTGNGQLGF